MKKRNDLDQFLAAPESVLHDKAERRKAIERKARDAAKAEQLRRGKLRTKPTIEDLLADLVPRSAGEGG